MAKRLIAAVVFSIVFYVFTARAEKIGLVWDPPDAEIDGYHLYQGNPDVDFALVSTPQFPSGDIPADVTAIELDLPGRGGLVYKYMWYIRAYRGADESANSNQVGYKVVNTTPLTPAGLTGSYMDGRVTLQWTQPAEDHPVDHWELFYRLDADWIKLGVVAGDQELKLSAPFTAAPAGVATSVDFTVVAYRRSGVFSANSGVFTLDINRQAIPAPTDLKVVFDVQ